MRSVTICVLVATVGAFASGAASSGERRLDRRCYAVRVEAVQNLTAESAPRRRFRDRFSADDLLDLRFVVSLPAASRAGLVEIELYTPSGRLYDVLKAESDPDTAGGRGRYRHRRTRVVAARLPVAGSHVTGRGLYGTWDAKVYLDGTDEDCNRTRFVIDP